MMLDLVQTADVLDVFNQLVYTVPDTVQIDSLHDYFERTWIAGLNGRAARYHLPLRIKAGNKNMIHKMIV